MYCFQDFAKENKKELEKSLLISIDDLCSQVLQTQQWSQVLKDLLSQYVLGGKMIRGLLVLYWARVYNSESKDVFAVASAVELLQAFLLIHDDIMDKDILRRNMPSFHVRLSDYVRTKSASEDANHIGESLAICAGDIVYSYCFRILSLHMPSSVLASTIALFSENVCKVGEAQMHDVFWESVSDIPSSQEILLMYEGKTGHYTFSLPAILGYLYAAGASTQNNHNVEQDDTIKSLSSIGGLMGQLFQIRDDVLDIRQDSQVSGKPRGSDLISRKKTFFISMLFESARENQYCDQLKQILKLESQETIGEDEVLKVCYLADTWNVWKKIDAIYTKLLSEIESQIKKLNISEDAKKSVLALAQSMVEREK